MLHWPYYTDHVHCHPRYFHCYKHSYSSSLLFSSVIISFGLSHNSLYVTPWVGFQTGPHTSREWGRVLFFVKTLIMNVCLDGRYRHFPIDNWIYYWMTHSVKLKQIYRKFGSITTELSRLDWLWYYRLQHYSNQHRLSPAATVNWNNWHPLLPLSKLKVQD